MKKNKKLYHLNGKSQEKVLTFARDLIEDGIEVIFDRWLLMEGNDA